MQQKKIRTMSLLIDSVWKHIYVFKTFFPFKIDFLLLVSRVRRMEVIFVLNVSVCDPDHVKLVMFLLAGARFFLI